MRLSESASACADSQRPLPLPVEGLVELPGEISARVILVGGPGDGRQRKKRSDECYGEEAWEDPSADGWVASSHDLLLSTEGKGFIPRIGLYRSKVLPPTQPRGGGASTLATRQNDKKRILTVVANGATSPVIQWPMGFGWAEAKSPRALVEDTHGLDERPRPGLSSRPSAGERPRGAVGPVDDPIGHELEVACEFEVPEPPAGEQLDLDTVEVVYSSGGVEQAAQNGVLGGDERWRPWSTSAHMSTSHKRLPVASGAPGSTDQGGLCAAYPHQMKVGERRGTPAASRKRASWRRAGSQLNAPIPCCEMANARTTPTELKGQV